LGQLEIGPAAEDLQPGVPYQLKIPPSWYHTEEPKYLRGSYNIHFPLTFAHGEQWLARIHLNSEFVSIGDASSIIRACEAATLQSVAALAPEFIPAFHISRTQNGELSLLPL
jgi:hypothetical protein